MGKHGDAWRGRREVMGTIVVKDKKDKG